MKNCLEGGSGTPQSAKYLVYRLPGESTLIGTECVICLEEFVKDSMVARLSCLCTFHNGTYGHPLIIVAKLKDLVFSVSVIVASARQKMS